MEARHGIATSMKHRRGPLELEEKGSYDLLEDRGRTLVTIGSGVSCLLTFLRYRDEEKPPNEIL